MRKLVVLLASAGLLLGLTSSAQAGQFVTNTSTIALALGGLPGAPTSALPGTESLVALNNGSGGITGVGHNILASATVWSTVNFGPGTALFTGVPLISNLKITVKNQAGVLQDGFLPGTASCVTNKIGGGACVSPTADGQFGGVLKLSGQTVIFAAGGGIKLPVPLNKIGGLTGGGGIGSTTAVTLIGNNITAENGPFISGSWKITGVTSNIITIPARGNLQGVGFTLQRTSCETAMTPSTNGGYVSISMGAPFENHTVTITGTNNLASGGSSQAGAVTVIAPLRIATGVIAGNIPGSGTLVFNFVPEPGTVLLLVSGAVGLAIIGRRRMRK